MKHLFIVCFLLPFCLAAQSKKTNPQSSTSELGHRIQITLKPYQDTKIYLGSNYGNAKTLVDSCVLNNKSEGVFASKQKLTPGIYFVVSPKMSILFDLLVDDKQQFSIVADTLNLKNMTITGSKENELFQNYSKSMNNLFMELNGIEQQFKTAATAKDSNTFKEAYLNKDKQIKQIRKSFVEANPNSMMSFLLNTMEIPDAPSIPTINGKADSLYPFRYVKNHFWDKVVFNDNRLVRTPFFEGKLDKIGRAHV